LLARVFRSRNLAIICQEKKHCLGLFCGLQRFEISDTKFFVIMAFCLLIYSCLQICALLGWFGAGAGRECADFGKISGFFFLSPLQGL
jgi:hypothetical protein